MGLWGISISLAVIGLETKPNLSPMKGQTENHVGTWKAHRSYKA